MYSLLLIFINSSHRDFFGRTIHMKPEKDGHRAVARQDCHYCKKIAAIMKRASEQNLPSPFYSDTSKVSIYGPVNNKRK